LEGLLKTQKRKGERTMYNYGFDDGRDGSLVELAAETAERVYELRRRDFKKHTEEDREKEIEELKQSLIRALVSFDGSCITLGCVAIIGENDLELPAGKTAVVFISHRVEGIPLEVDAETLKEIDELKPFSKVMFISANAEMAQNILGKGLGHIVYENKNNGGTKVNIEIVDLYSPELGGKILKKVVNF
jgi:hypothetical protein